MTQRHHGRGIAIVLAAGLGFLGPWGSSPALAATTTRVSVASGGVQVPGGGRWPAISADGRFVAFEGGSGLVPGDTNSRRDVFVHDRQTGQTTRVSVASDGSQGDDDSQGAAISSDGRFVAFHSRATNLVAGDTNGWTDVFVHDRQTGQTTRVSVATGGTQGDAASSSPSISSDGRFVAFDSEATNLVAGDTNGRKDVFVRDRQAGETTRVSIAPGGGQSDNNSALPSISADGCRVAFASYATNLIVNDTNGHWDVFVHDREEGLTTRVSVASGGTEGNERSDSPSISSDGRFVAFFAVASNLVPGDTNGWGDIFVHDCQTAETTRVSVASGGTEANDRSGWPAISPDGWSVAFMSYATNLVSGDTNGCNDIFIHDRLSGATTRVNIASDGTQANGGCGTTEKLSVSSGGQAIAFLSAATNLVPGDTNQSADVFVHDRGVGAPTIILVDPSSGPPGTEGTISGSNLGATAGSIVFTPNSGNPGNLEVLTWSSTLVTFRVPGNTPIGPGQVKVARNDAVESNGLAFEVTGPTEVCVDDSNATGTEDGSAQHPYRTVQAGLNAVVDGGAVKVARGTYSSTMTFSGKRATIQGGYAGGTYPGTGDFGESTRDPNPATNGTAMDGGGAAVTVWCADTAARGSVLTGFTIRDGGVVVRGGVVLKRVIAQHE